MPRISIFVLLAACNPASLPPVETDDTDSVDTDDTTQSWYPDEIPAWSQSSGVIDTSGADAIGALPPGRGGAVLFGIGTDAGSDFDAGTEDLVVPEGETRALTDSSWRHCTVAGTVTFEDTLRLVCAGNLAITGTVRGRSGTKGGDLSIHVQGTFAIDGLVDLAATNPEAEGAGPSGGSFGLFTTEPRAVAIPSIVTRGGDANFSEEGGAGGPVEVRLTGGGDAVTLTLSGAAASDPLFPVQTMYSRGRYWGGCGPDCPDGWQTLPTTYFRRGILTSGGTGGDTPATTTTPAADAADGGDGGDVQIYVGHPHLLAIDHVDVFTGPAAEEVDVYWDWQYADLTVFALTGGLGGGGGYSASSTGGGGGDGGRGGDLSITGTLDAPITQAISDNIAWNACPSVPEIGTSGKVYTGTRDGDDDPIYRFSAAGGWGGIPGASGVGYPDASYPARFGAAGREGAVVVELP